MKGDLAAPLGTLVGRDDELAVVHRAIADLVAGTGTVLTVVGDPGSGKTALVRHLADRATEAGAATVQATGYELSRSMPYAPVVSMLRRPLRGPGGAELAARLDALELLFADVPVERGDPPAPAAPVSTAPDLARARLQSALVTVLRRMAERGPLVVVFDDVHWMDPSSIEVLHELTTETSDLPVLVAATARRDDAEERAEVRALLRGLRRMERAAALSLAPLDRDGVAALVRQRLGDEPPAELVDLAVARAAGVPLLVEALLRALADAGALRREGLHWVLRDVDVRVPEAADLLGVRVDHLAPADRRELAVLALAGEPVGEEALGPDGLQPTERRAALARLRDAGLAIDALDDGGVIRWRPAHPMIADVAADHLSIGERRTVHAAFFAASAGATPERRARHLLGAGESVDRREALEVFVEAGTRALAQGAVVEACRFLSAAVEIQPDIEADPTMATVHELLGDAWARRGELHLAHHHLMVAYRDHERRGDRPAQVALLTRIDSASLQGGAEPIVDDDLAALIDQLRVERRWSDLAMAAAAAMVSRTRRGRFAEARLLLDTATEAAERATDDRSRLLAVTLRATRLLLWLDPARPFDARTLVEDLAAAEAEAVALGEIDIADRCSQAIAEVGFTTRLPDLLDLAVASQRATIERSGRQHAWRLSVLRLIDGVEDGDAVARDELMAGYLADVGPRGTITIAINAAPLVHLGALTIDADELVAQTAGARDAVDADGVIAALADATEVLLRGEAVDTAVAARLVDDHDVPVFVPSGNGVTGLVAHALAEHRLGRTDRFEQWLACFEAIEGGAGQLSAWAARLRAECGPPGDAAAQQARAATRFRDVGRPTSAACCLLAAARAGAVDLPADAVDHAIDALTTAGRSDLADELAQRAARRTPTRATVGPGELTAREREVADAVATGMTNKEVADALFISVRTVTTHLERIYAKLGVRGRRDLARTIASGDGGS